MPFLPQPQMSVAVLDSLSLMRASMEEEVVLQSALAVPAHHALACRIEAYGTPFGCAAGCGEPRRPRAFRLRQPPPPPTCPPCPSCCPQPHAVRPPPPLRAHPAAPPRAPPLQAVVQGELSEDDKQFAACLAAPPDFDADLAAGGATPGLSLQRMASIRVLQSPSLAARDSGLTPAASAAKRAGGELLRSPSVQHSDKKNRRGAPAPGGVRRGSGAVDDALAAMEPESPAPAGAAAAAAGAAPDPLAALFQGDAVAALVGTGYLLLRAAGFDRRTPAAVGRLSVGLRQQSVERRLSGALARAAADVAVAGA
jgi:hypothetical protein